MSEEVTVGRDASIFTIVVSRSQGSCGDITFNYTTKDGSAIHGFDYEHTEGTVAMAEGVLQSRVEVTILKMAPHPEDRRFCFHVTSSTEGVLFDPETNGGADSAICEVSIAGRPGTCRRMRRYFAMSFNRRRFLLGLSMWREQMIGAFFCNGSPSDQKGASLFDWIFHCVSLFWKFLSAMLPPTVFCTGWSCFFCALLSIALVTVVIIDLAYLLGCVLGIANEVTAITLVALGTSLPDTFASRLAAQNDDTADNAIGNVTGSNAVNVFLGMGLPWTVGTLYWRSQGKTDEWLTMCHGASTYAELFEDMYPSGGLIIPAGRLFYSVGVFTICALICVVLLMYRRRYCGGELGGSLREQYTHSAALVFLWLVYIGTSIALTQLVPTGASA
jgi:solute carrier family 8 (sodium/calcium exchanger)